MTKLKTIAGALMLVALLGTFAQAQNENGVRVTVPFDFHAAGRTFAAGDYVVTPSENRAFLHLREVATGKTVPMLTSVNEIRDGKIALDFEKVDGQAYLKSISNGTVAYELTVPRAARQMARVQPGGNAGQ